MKLENINVPPKCSFVRPLFSVLLPLPTSIFPVWYLTYKTSVSFAILTPSQRHRWSGAAAECRHQQPRHNQVDPARPGAREQIQVLPAFLHHGGLRACRQRRVHHHPRIKWVFKGPESKWLDGVYVRERVTSRWRQWAHRRRRNAG